MPFAFCRLNPHDLICDKDNFETKEGLIFFAFFLNLLNTASAAATLICCPIMLLHNE